MIRPANVPTPIVLALTLLLNGARAAPVELYAAPESRVDGDRLLLPECGVSIARPSPDHVWCEKEGRKLPPHPCVQFQCVNVRSRVENSITIKYFTQWKLDDEFIEGNLEWLSVSRERL